MTTLEGNRTLKLRISCPHCGAGAFVRSSEQVTAMVRDVYLQCANHDCGFSWKAQLSFVHSLSPSAMARPGLNLPGPPADYIRRYFPAGAREPGDDPGGQMSLLT